MKFFSLFFLASLISVNCYGLWKLRPVYKKAPGADVDRSVLYFSSAEKTKTYAPTKPPYGLVDHKRFEGPKDDLFITSWAKGSKTILIKVFDMSKDNPNPICEVTSFSEALDLKVENSQIFIKAVQDETDKELKWVKCSSN